MTNPIPQEREDALDEASQKIADARANQPERWLQGLTDGKTSLEN